MPGHTEGTKGIRCIRNLCREYGVAEPKIEVSEHWFTMTFLRSAEQVAIKAAEQVTEQVTEQVPEQVVRLLSVLREHTMSGQELMDAVGLQHRPTFLYSYLQPALKEGLIEMTIPEKPRSSKQRYRLTGKGREFLKALELQP